MHAVGRHSNHALPPTATHNQRHDVRSVFGVLFPKKSVFISVSQRLIDLDLFFSAGTRPATHPSSRSRGPTTATTTVPLLRAPAAAGVFYRVGRKLLLQINASAIRADSLFFAHHQRFKGPIALVTNV